MKGGEASSPAAREKRRRGSLSLGWSLDSSGELDGLSGFCSSPSRTSLGECVPGICHTLSQVLLALGASLMKTGKDRFSDAAWCVGTGVSACSSRD